LSGWNSKRGSLRLVKKLPINTPYVWEVIKMEEEKSYKSNTYSYNNQLEGNVQSQNAGSEEEEGLADTIQNVMNKVTGLGETE